MVSHGLVLMSLFWRGGSDIVDVWQYVAKVRKVIRPKTRGTLGLLGVMLATLNTDTLYDDNEIDIYCLLMSTFLNSSRWTEKEGHGASNS